MKKNPASESGLLTWRILIALALCSGSAWLAMFSFAATPRTVSYVQGGFTFSMPVELDNKSISPLFFQEDGEPEIKVDNYGDIYVTAINGVPGGTDLWKSTDKGATFVYLGQPDGTLLVKNKTGSGTGAGAVQVNTGTLGGTGKIAGAVTVGTGTSSGAILLAGNSATKPGTH